MTDRTNRSDIHNNSIHPHSAGEVPSAGFVTEKNIAFSQRVALADEKTRSRYNAAKDAFFGYVASDGVAGVMCDADVFGESFRLGGVLLGKIRLVRGYVRLFLNLDPKKYPQDEYLINDYSRQPMYADCPLEIDICSAASLSCAYALTREVMRVARAVPAAGHVARDWSAEYDGSHLINYPLSDAAAVQAADAALSDDKICDDIPEVPAAGEGRAEDKGVPAAQAVFAAAAAKGDYVPPSPVRVPSRAKVVDARGDKVGKVRKGIWYDLEGRVVGMFRRAESRVVQFADDVAHRGYVDKNDNVVTLNGEYVATLRRFPVALLALVLALLVLVTVLTGTLSAHFLARSDSIDYAPVLFVADEHGINWQDDENLPVFYNAQFGTEKIAPGMSGSYAFTLRNDNSDAIEFSLGFSCENRYGIALSYSLWRDGVCLSGEEKIAPEALGLNGMTLEERSSTVFVLEWEWLHNDEADTAAGENGAVYTLTITFSATVRADRG